MELRYLRYFVTVAECQHFTRAAEKLGIAQPPLSQQIKKLEQEVGVPLFERLSRGVALTPAGQVLYDDAVKILAQLDHAVQRVKQVARGERNQLRLGFASSTVVSQAVLELVRRLQQSHPDIDFQPIELPMPALVETLRQQDVDLAFLRLPCYASEHVAHTPLFSDPFKLVVPAHHAFAKQQSVTLSQLGHDPIILFPRDIGPGLHDALVDGLKGAGLTPSNASLAPQLHSATAMVSAGFGIALVPESLTTQLSDHVAVVSVEDMPLVSHVVLAWQRTNTARMVRQCIHTAREQIERLASEPVAGD
ncbi:hypothetical protein BZG05_12815 [Salinivibrio kushneri]|uniref:LysR family transcriptional regulator n=1 Tax=Salinivibrio kushneri TaxID=1908198 RepID=UPI0009896496|nr:LysR family transcriptional regulator [Salinivibrio kushneri]OOE32839.1 hypothetical protein BZG05_12815 [Salinivibrio kushneri]